MRRQLPQGALEKAAYLASIGRKQHEIADQLGISAATVNRLVRTAERKGILKVLAPELTIEPNRRRQIERDLQGRDALFQKLKVVSRNTLKQLDVLESTRLESPLVTVASAAANYVLEDVLQTAQFVAITWGASTREIVSAIERAAAKRRLPSDLRIQFVQVCGDPQGAIANPSLRCSTLVAKLNSAINNSDSSPYTFSMSASIPGRFTPKQVITIRDYIQEVGGYSKVFTSPKSGRQRLRLEIDVLVTSCGNGRSGEDRWLSECAKVAGIDEGRLERLTIGNIGGYWLPKQDLAPGELKILNKINSRWNGIVVEDIELIARNRGVVLLAAESYKAETVFRLVEHQLVSRLFISDVLEQALSSYINSRGGHPGVLAKIPVP
jgi:DNA-binding Lrp family transcriptional regulator